MNNKQKQCLLPAGIFLLAFLAPQLYYRFKEKKYRLQAAQDADPLQQAAITPRGDVLDLAVRAHGGLTLHAVLYPHASPNGLVQIIHGIQEHKGRYDHFARFLRENGYAVLTSDLRGHGLSVGDANPRGYLDNAYLLAGDQRLLSRILKAMHPGVPLHLFGHSLGSLIARLYLQENDKEIEKLVLCGTAQYFPGVEALLPLSRALTFYTGEYAKSPPLSRLSRSLYGRMPWSGLEENRRRRVRTEPYFQQRFHNRGLMTLFELDKAISDPRAYRMQNPDLRILSISGQRDLFFAGGEAGIARTMKLLSRAGYRDLISIVYRKMGHEILRDPDRQRVYQDILSFLNT